MTDELQLRALICALSTAQIELRILMRYIGTGDDAELPAKQAAKACRSVAAAIELAQPVLRRPSIGKVAGR